MKLSNIKVIEKKVKNNDNGISYLFTEMQRLNSKIDNVAARVAKLEHNQKIELNNKN